MKLYIKQRVLSVLDNYNIFDEYNNIIYTVKGRLSVGHKLEIYDISGNCIATIREQLMTFSPKFKIYVNDQYMGCFYRKPFSVIPEYRFDFNDWFVKGNIIGTRYTIYVSKREIAIVNKKILRPSDCYEIDVKNQSDVLYTLIVVLAIDAENCTANKAN